MANGAARAQAVIWGGGGYGRRIQRAAAGAEASSYGRRRGAEASSYGRRIQRAAAEASTAQRRRERPWRAGPAPAATGQWARSGAGGHIQILDGCYCCSAFFKLQPPGSTSTPRLHDMATNDRHGACVDMKEQVIVLRQFGTTEGMENLLPEDVLTNIIRRLAPRYVAISRCVCKTWCAIIDARNLLRADLLPRSVRGIFINFNELSMSEFFSRPSKGRTVSGNFNYLPLGSRIIGHCNGLLLFCNYVVNPATRQSAPLPPCTSPNIVIEHFFRRDYLVFDPQLSPHYEVFMIPRVRCYGRYEMLNSDDELDPAMEGLEWPPSPWTLNVFSSRTKVWEERSFVREGEAAGNVADRRLDRSCVQDNSVYWRGVLYVNCQTKFVMRISLSNGKYQVIKPPVYFERMECTDLYLGKSVKGVHCALYGFPSSIWIYILDESSGRTEWVFKHSCDIQPYQRIDGRGPWTLQDINSRDWSNEFEDGNDEAIVQEKFEWDSDNDNVIDTISRGNHLSRRYITFLGFHPYKEVVFLSDTLRRGLAYHLNSSKIQDLGNINPTHYGTEDGIQPFIQASFPCTPWTGVFPEDN